MSKITYENKVALNVNSDIADINKCNASDLNEIKNVVNTNDDDFNTLNINVGNITQLNTTNKSSMVNAINEVNNKFNYSTEEQVIGKWTNGKPLYRKIVSGNVPQSDQYPTVATGITNLDEVVSISLLLAYGDNRQYFSSTRYTYYLGKENGNQITIVAPDVGGDATFTIYYTKTTD